MPSKYILLTLPLLLVSACKKNSGDSPSGSTGEVPAVYKKIYGASDIYVDDDYIIIKSNGLPDHKSPYYQGTQWSDKYEAYNGSNSQWSQNPNKIATSNLTFKIPRNPREAGTHTATPLGPMGISLNGVPFYNQYAGPNNQALTNEVNSFDQYNGHPQQFGGYHYHVEPLWLTTNKGSDALLGFLLDGFPVYGPKENGALVDAGSLDEFHGHSHATADYPGGIYHYHTTAAAPYINGSGFYGVAGTVTQ